MALSGIDPTLPALRDATVKGEIYVLDCYAVSKNVVPNVEAWALGRAWPFDRDIVTSTDAHCCGMVRFSPSTHEGGAGELTLSVPIEISLGFNSEK